MSKGPLNKMTQHEIKEAVKEKYSKVVKERAVERR